MNFSRFLDIQSWWEVPSIAYFCSLFRTAFNLLDFDIEELEEALLTDGTEESASSLLTELIVRLLNGCLGNSDVSAFNYQMYLRRLFRRKCQETGRYNPFNTDIDFQFLPLRTKVEILYALCDFRLDADDVLNLFKNLEAESLRVEPLGWDANDSAYWYFYGTRLYREDIIKKTKAKTKKKKSKEGKKRGWFYGDDWLDDEETERVWQVVCFTEEDWTHLTDKFSKATNKVEKELHRSLSQNFLPEIPRLFQEKERLQRKRLLEAAPRRTSSRVLQKIKQKEEENKPSESESKETEEEDKKQKESEGLARENRAKRRDLLRTRSGSSDTSEGSTTDKEMPQKATAKRPKNQDKRSKNSSATNKGEPPPEMPIKTGRKTNNSLASATGQIVIPDAEEPVSSTRKKLKTSQIFSQTEEDIQTDMYKVLEQLIAHEDAWPFMDPVEEEYAPNYYAVIRRPMDLRKMEERLDSGYYTDFAAFKGDFKLIVNNCRLYNGQDNEYTMMVDNLQAAFDRLTEKYIHRLSSSDEEIAVEYQIPTPSRKHKLKRSESPLNHKRKKRKTQTDKGEGKSSDPVKNDNDAEVESPEKDNNESHHKTKDGKVKKKRKGHHRHGKHSKTHKKDHKGEHSSKGSKHSKKQKHGKDKDGKKQKKKKNKHAAVVDGVKNLRRSSSQESLESCNRSRSASPLPSIHTPSPEPDFYKDKYDKIKERRRLAASHAFEALIDHKHRSRHDHPPPEKDKNPKLSETIEKLKAKNEKYKDISIFGNFYPKEDRIKKSDTKPRKKVVVEEDIDDPDFTDEDTYDHEKEKEKQRLSKKGNKKGTSVTKNESASEALEQAVKDISKWLDDAPKGSSGSSPCDSPAQTISTEEQDSRLDDDFLGGMLRSRKRPSSREPKLMKRREVQRTIDRLQPGKSKGNLISNISNKVEKVEDASPGTDVSKEESSPKLSLGSVLPTVEFTLGKDHNFADDEEKEPVKEDSPEAPVEQEEKIVTPEEVVVKPKEPVSEPKTEEPKEEPKPEVPVMKLSQEKATPNLSAWFKAFGTPKSTTPTSVPPLKKKVEDTEHEDKPAVEPAPTETKPVSPKNTCKYDSPTEAGTPDSGRGPARARRTSTGSSVSERSSFSQDLDSPRHHVTHSSPMLHSPASPRADEFQKISYPIINGTVRAGFYQDTTSIKSSPEKSCSPREGPQSPYSPYSHHVYASNNAAGSTAPNYFVDHNKSPLPTYGQNQPPPYYDNNKMSGPYTQSAQYGSYSPVASPYAGTPGYSQPERSPHPAPPPEPPQDPPKPPQFISDNTKANALFPVKKRTYSEIDPTPTTPKKVTEKESTPVNSNDYQKIVHAHPMSSSTTSVDDIAAALSERSRNLKEKTSPNYTERSSAENRASYSDNTSKRDAPLNPIAAPAGMNKNDNVDMVNMGYMNPEQERTHVIDTNENPYTSAVNTRESHKPISAQPKGYEIDAIAMNLGMSSHANVMQKVAPKSSVASNVIPQAHSHPEISHGLSHAHLAQYQGAPVPAPPSTNFSLTDIELANKKLYTSAASASTAIDYGGWKMTNQLRKPDVMPSDYSAYGAANADKMKVDLTTSTANTAAINYNKNMQHPQYHHNYNVPRTSLPRTQDVQQNLPAELRIPNPRNLIKNDNLNIPSSLSSSDLTKSMDSAAKSQKAEKLIQNHPLVGSIQYKTPYSAHSTLPLESLRNLPNIPQMLERYTNDEQRYLSSFAAAGGSSLYHDKSFQMAQMFNRSMASDVHTGSTTSAVYSQSPLTISKEASVYKTAPTQQNTQSDTKTKSKRKRTTDTKSPVLSNQTYHNTPHSGDMMQSVKSSMVPGSAFNFGATPNMALGGGLYAENSGFSIEDFRNSTANQLMAANYMAAAAAASVSTANAQRAEAAAGVDKAAKSAHQKFPLVSPAAARGPYGLMGAEYQQYLHRQEELLRQTMSLYPPGYPALAARHQYDAINRPSWL